MKWALFEFEDSSCEVGESAWVIGEDENLFNNTDWFSSKEIIVKWPKLRKQLTKASVDIDEVETERYPAKIVKFSDNFSTINEHLKTYVQTGSTKTPTRGRGHRVARKNPLFEDSSDEDKENHQEKPQFKKLKRGKIDNASKSPMFDVLQKKYGHLSSELPSPHENGLEREVMSILKESNEDLKCQLGKLQMVVDNLKGLPSIIESLKETVDELKTISLQTSPRTSHATPARTPHATPTRTPHATPTRTPHASTSRALHASASRTPHASPAVSRFVPTMPSRSSSPSSPSFADVSEEICGHDSTTIEIHPGISILPSQKKLLDAIGELKTYVYSIMEMLWSRDVLATHSMTGKVSNAHKDKEAKPCLDQAKVTALCELLMKRFRLANDKDIRKHIKAKLNNIEKCHKLKNKIKPV